VLVVRSLHCEKTGRGLNFWNSMCSPTFPPPPLPLPFVMRMVNYGSTGASPPALCTLFATATYWTNFGTAMII
jgi:hypothetical protein